MIDYLAVHCQTNPQHVIPLKVLEAGKAAWFVGPFKADCPECKSSHEHTRGRVIEWKGPSPDGTFQTHKAFLNQS